MTMPDPLGASDYQAGFAAGETAERALVVLYLKGALLTERAAAIARGDHNRAWIKNAPKDDAPSTAADAQEKE
jgi:uncharacterized protein RhaS with RHS repeats